MFTSWTVILDKLSRSILAAITACRRRGNVNKPARRSRKMAEPQRQLVLGAHFPSMGQHIAAWLHPDSQLDAGQNFPYFAQLAQTAERAKFDFVFMADAVATRDGNMEALSRWPQYMAHFEPITLLSATAALTRHIGLVCTASTSYYEPFNVARLFGSLDHISGGRAGWNVVTSANASASFNFNRDEHYDIAERYQRAREFVQVVLGLWDSWEDDAFLRDRASRRYFDSGKLHQLNHKGTFFSVRGPLNLARPPQGHPVIAQAGASEDGKELGAETAEVIFFSQQRIAAAQGFYRDVKGRMAKFGRAPQQLKMLAGLNPTVGKTTSEAQAKFDYLQSLIHPDVGKELLSVDLGGADLSGLSIDEPIPDHLIPEKTRASMSRLTTVGGVARQEKPTIRELYERYAGSRGSYSVVGTPAYIADQMEEWLTTEAADGFIIQASYLPGGFDDFANLVVPELQRRGLFRTGYTGESLRHHLGLRRPENRHVRQN
jgi:FMN-dependent oxidoreductase (nitrilotriacetate monooxygenase family)